MLSMERAAEQERSGGTEDSEMWNPTVPGTEEPNLGVPKGTPGKQDSFHFVYLLSSIICFSFPISSGLSFLLEVKAVRKPGSAIRPAW